MVDNDDRRRAAAKCEECGTIGIVHIWANGTRKPLGQSTFCACDEPTLQELEDDLDVGEERS